MIAKIKSIIMRINPRDPRLIIGILLILIIPFIVLILNINNDQQNIVKYQKENPVNGMIYKGLGERKKTGICMGLFEIKTGGNSVCTHGPDPAPPGIDVRKRREPGFASKHQSSAQNKSKVAGTTCDADGKSGRRVQVLFVHASDMEDRFAAFIPDFRVTLANLNQRVIDSAAETGGSRHIRFVHDGNCEPIIEHVVLSPAGDDSYENTARELAAKGYNKNNRKYLIWRDANQLCGIADAPQDDTPGLNNLSNVVSGNSVIDNGCWGSETELHELGHSLGAVQKSSPGHDASHQYHASNVHDVLYWTRGERTCLWDCENDDYFSTNPSSGSYLATHWNIGYNEFLGGDEDKRPKYVPSIYSDVYVVNRQGGSGKTEIHALSGSSDFKDFSIHAASALHTTEGNTWSFAMGLHNDQDNIPDIYAINRNGGSGKTEVHILSGKSNFADFALQNATELGPTEGSNWVFDIGNGPDDDPNADLFAINKQGGGGKTEVHILQGGPEKDYKDFSLHAETGLHATDKNWDFVLGSYNDNFSAGTDLYAINRRGASGKTEVHILSAESEYKDFILHATTPLEATDSSNWSFTTGYFDNDLKADLYAINRNGASGKTEVHVLSGASEFKDFIVHAASGLESTNNKNWTFVPSQDYEDSTVPKPTDSIGPSKPPIVTVKPSDPPVGGPNPTDPPIITKKPTDKPNQPAPTWVCGGSKESICVSPTTTGAPHQPGPTISQAPNVTEEPTLTPTTTPMPDEDCLNVNSPIEVIQNWVKGFLKKINDYIQVILGNPTSSVPPPQPCVKQ